MSRRLAGVGGIGFAVLLLAGIVAASPPGGTYEESSVIGFLASGHHKAIVLSIYLVVLAALGLIVLIVRLRELAGSKGAARVVWGTGMTAVAALVTGFMVTISVPMAMLVGGSQVTIDPKLAFIVGEVGDSMIFGAAGILLGLTLIVLAMSRPALPSSLRWFTLVCGVLGLGSPLFFPSVALPLWGLVVGFWLLRPGAAREVALGALAAE